MTKKQQSLFCECFVWLPLAEPKQYVNYYARLARSAGETEREREKKRARAHTQRQSVRRGMVRDSKTETSKNIAVYNALHHNATAVLYKQSQYCTILKLLISKNMILKHRIWIAVYILYLWHSICYMCIVRHEREQHLHKTFSFGLLHVCSIRFRLSVYTMIPYTWCSVSWRKPTQNPNEWRGAADESHSLHLLALLFLSQ